MIYCAKIDIVKNINTVKAFSLLELMIGVCVLAIVGTISIPLFSYLQSRAQSSVAAQISDELNSTYLSWKASGGIENVVAGGPGYSYTSDLLSVIVTEPSAGTRHSNNGAVVDSGLSNLVGASLPPGTPDYTLSGIAPAAVVDSNDYAIAFNGSQFTVTALSATSGTGGVASSGGSGSGSGAGLGSCSGSGSGSGSGVGSGGSGGVNPKQSPF